MIEQDYLNPHMIEHFDVDKLINFLDPDILWKAVCLLTKPSSQKVRTTHVRKIRRIFVVCNILFTINRQCSFPLHTLIADLVEVQAGCRGC